MMKSQMPNIPGVGAMTDTLDFVKNLWGGMGIPGMVAPTMSVDELDKKIADLKAVDAWLSMNQSMLRGTIQALEVQRGTIATLKAMGATLADAVKQPGANEKSVMAAAPYVSAFFPQAASEPSKPAAKAEAKPAAEAVSDATTAAMTNPVMWWNMLQEQFSQAVATSMSPEAVTKASAMAQQAASSMSAATARPADAAGKETQQAEPAPDAAKAAATKPKNGKAKG